MVRRDKLVGVGIVVGIFLIFLFVPMMTFTISWSNGRESANASPSFVYLGCGMPTNPTVVAVNGTTLTMQTWHTPLYIGWTCRTT